MKSKLSALVAHAKAAYPKVDEVLKGHPFIVGLVLGLVAGLIL